MDSLTRTGAITASRRPRITLEPFLEHVIELARWRRRAEYEPRHAENRDSGCEPRVIDGQADARLAQLAGQLAQRQPLSTEVHPCSEVIDASMRARSARLTSAGT